METLVWMRVFYFSHFFVCLVKSLKMTDPTRSADINTLCRHTPVDPAALLQTLTSFVGVKLKVFNKMNIFGSKFCPKRNEH